MLVKLKFNGKHPDQHSSKRTKMADTTPNPEGSGLNAESPSEIVAMDYTSRDDLPPESPEQLSMVNDMITWLSHNSVFNDFFVLPEQRELVLERLQTVSKKGRDLVTVHVENHTESHLMWDFSRWAVKMVGTNDAKLKEREFTTTIIDKDYNNFHAWSHRQWVLQTFCGNAKDELWEDELAYCAKIIDEDPVNNFAWDQRYFVVTGFLQEIYEARICGDLDHSWNAEDYFDEKRDEEVAYAIKFIEAEPGNHCPWIHIRGLYGAFTGFMSLDLRVQGAILRVLEDEKDCLDDLGTMDDGSVYFMNPRGIINALNVLLDLLDHGFYRDIHGELGKKFRDVIDALCPDSSLSKPSVYRKVYSVLIHAEKNLTACGLAWRNAGAEVFGQGLSIVKMI